jgi:hypothetical protein
MKTVIKFFYATFILIIFMGCSNESIEEVATEAVTPVDISRLTADFQEMIQKALSQESIESGLVVQRSGNNNERSKEDVIEYATGDVVGHLKITRSADGANFKWHSIGLIPGDAVTMWIILFTIDENGNPMLVDVVWGGGEIVNAGGVFNLESFLANGDSSGSIIGGPGMESTDGMGFHVLNRTHGQYIEGSQQLTTVWDCHPVTGCEDLSDSIHYPN